MQRDRLYVNNDVTSLPRAVSSRAPSAERVAALAQGSYYLGTGLWPLVHMDSFERVTGPKRDRWLVRTVGILVAAIGGGLLLAGLRRRVTPELAFLARSSAIGLAAIDLVYVARGRIAKIYLLDAAAEALLLAAWAAGGQSHRVRHH